MKFLRLLRFEFAKLVRMKLVRVLLVLLSMETMGKAAGMLMIQRDAQSMMNIGTGGTAGFLQALSVTSFFAVLILSLVFASLMISSERTTGGLRYLSSLPFSRTSIILSKIIMLLVFMATAVLIVGILNFLATWRLIGLEPIVDYDLELYTVQQVIAYYVQMHLIAFLHLFALASLGLLISVWSPTSGAAVAISVVLFFGIVGIETALELEWLHFYPLRYDATQGFETITKGLEGYSWLGDENIIKSIKYGLGYAAAFSIASVVSFLYRENYS